MIIHTVTFKTRHPSGSSQEKAFLREAMALAALPMVHNLQCYRQVGKKNDFEFGLTMEFDSQQSYDAYSAHPLHTGFVQDKWIPEVTDFLEIDYVKYEEA